MRALAVIPGEPNTASLLETPVPPIETGSLLVQTLAIGICGTDREILDGRYGSAPPAQRHLIIGHESLGEVISAPESSGFVAGDLIVGIVRRPDPAPCRYCAAGEWDMCGNGRYTERGIKELHGYASEQFRIEPEFAVKVDPALRDVGALLEPASIVAKAWDHVYRIGGRSQAWHPESVLVTGAGPIGLLAALMGKQRDLDVHVLDRIHDGTKPDLVRALGATYHSGDLSTASHLEPDIIIECTGATPVIADVVTRTTRSGIVCLAGVSSPGRAISLDLGGLNRRLVLGNDVIFGSVNANRSHYESAAASLAKGDRSWLSGLITRRVPLTSWQKAFQRMPDDVKVIVDFS